MKMLFQADEIALSKRIAISGYKKTFISTENLL